MIRTPQRVVWSEGMLMSPQHLQQQDAFHESHLAARLDAVSPWDFGVVAMAVSDKALAAGQLELESFAAVLPSGLPVAFTAGQPEAPAGRPIAPHFQPTQETLSVYVGVPREREGVPNVTDGDRATRARYQSLVRSVVDAAQAASSVSVTVARPQVHLLFGDEPREDFEVLPLVELQRDKSGGFSVRPTFMPPVLRLGVSPWLMSSLRSLVASLVTKRRSLAEGTRQRDAATVEFGPSDMTNFLLLHSIDGTLPLLKHLAETPEASPYRAYWALSQLAGQLSSFAVDGDPSTLPAYQHASPGATFEPLFARINSLVAARVRQDYVSLQLDGRDDGLHSARLGDEGLAGCGTVLLAARVDMPEQQVSDHLPRLAKIASWGAIGDLVAAATPGVPVKVTTRPPAEIPIRAGVVYFTLATRDAYWRGVLDERTVAVYLPPPFEPGKTKLELLGVKER